MTQIPRGPEDKQCPKWLSPMSEVCHKCPLWVKMQMTHPHDPKTTIDEWNCALAWQPLLLAAINNQIAGQLISLQKEVNELRNETKKAHDEQMTMGAIAVQKASEAVRSTVGDIVYGRPLREAQPLLPST